ncbi:ATPase [Pseudomonas sp. N040]|uniref:ATPase n=1 Tax=Pseudomonas sp. N040 TaxID=2785325 RepID=UPI0018A24F48|nr:ATPase [Pseudomonas sp. N040]MBF7730417.1 ATPase [Pseudomonas sp. N040]MBW7014060.1 ATPase [Pseudomonas sp. N040]
MRNDALDELEVVPSLANDARDRVDYAHAAKPEAPAHAAAPAGSRPAAARTAPLWALLGAVLIAFAGLAWWSFQQIAQLNLQLVATQESFAQISEEAAGRIKAITGKVVATESSVTSESESLKLRVKQLEGKLAELGKQQQNLLTQQSTQLKRGDVLAAEVKTQQADLQQADARLQTLAAAQQKLQSAQAALAAMDAQLKAQAGEIAALRQQGKSVARIEQDLLILRSELDNQAAKGNSTAEFDAFRAQITRNLNTLQAQIQTLQQQNAPRP